LKLLEKGNQTPQKRHQTGEGAESYKGQGEGRSKRKRPKTHWKATTQRRKSRLDARNRRANARDYIETQTSPPVALLGAHDLRIEGEMMSTILKKFEGRKKEQEWTMYLTIRL